MTLSENWCNPKDAYTCKPIQNRTDYLTYKDKLLNKDSCDTNCWPKDMFICYNDGKNPPSGKITDKATWEKLKQVIPDTFSIVDDPKKCDIPDIGKSWCDKDYNCGTIKSWDDYNSHKDDKILDSCDDCYPQGFWCDTNGGFVCNKVTNRDDYLSHKDTFSTNCNDCYPKGKSWCMNDFSDCKTIDNQSQWTGLDKNSGTVTDNCDNCFPKGLFWCDNNKSCNQINSQGEYRNAKQPFYDSRNMCVENCGTKSSSKVILWVTVGSISFIIIGLIIFLIITGMGKGSSSGSSFKMRRNV